MQRQGIGENEYSCIGPSVDYYSLLDQVSYGNKMIIMALVIVAFCHYHIIDMKMKEDGEVKYHDVNPYYSPADREEDIYDQLKGQGIEKISGRSIEYV